MENTENREAISAEHHHEHHGHHHSHGHEHKREHILHHYYYSIDLLRLILMAFACINLMGFPTELGPSIQKMCGFVAPAFFMMSGYLVLKRDDQRSARIKRTIKRAAIAFGVMLVVYFLVNWAVYSYMGFDIFEPMKSGLFWFNFIVLNVWQYDIGIFIWYLQALLYAYVIIYFMSELHILHYDWVVVTLCLLLTVLTGEFGGLINFNFYGMQYIPGNFFTRALPYILLGGLIHRKRNFFRRIPDIVWLPVGFFGIIMAFVEVILLDQIDKNVYSGHLMGLGLAAVAVCMPAFMHPTRGIHDSNFTGAVRPITRMIFYFMEGIGMLAAVIVAFTKPYLMATVKPLIGMFAYFVALLLAYGLYVLWNHTFMKKKNEQLKRAQSKNILDEPEE